MYDMCILLSDGNSGLSTYDVAKLYGISRSNIATLTKAIKSFDGDKEQFIQEFRDSKAPSVVRFAMTHNRQIKPPRKEANYMNHNTETKMINLAKQLGSGEITDPELHQKLQKFIRNLMYYYPVTHEFTDNNWIKYAPCNVCGVDAPPEGHDVVRKNGLLVPICLECLETSYEIDYESLARLYFVEMLNLQHAYEEIL